MSAALLKKLFEMAMAAKLVSRDGGRHEKARRLRGQARRAKGRVKANVRHKAGRSVYGP